MQKVSQKVRKHMIKRKTIDESIKSLEKARDSIAPYIFLDEAIDQSMKTAIETMRKYQKIKKGESDEICKSV